jgi:hypothetical protein
VPLYRTIEGRVGLKQSKYQLFKTYRSNSCTEGGEVGWLAISQFINEPQEKRMASKIARLLFVLLFMFMNASLVIAGTPAPEGAHLYIISPENGETVSTPFTVQFGLKGIGVAPAGVEKANTGHHHLLIDVDELPPMDKPLPSDEQHRHFGGGQTEVTLDLPKGQHSLQLLLGDKNHVPFMPPVISEKITITVK